MKTICDAETFGRFLLQAGWVLGDVSAGFEGSLEYIAPGKLDSVIVVFDKSFADYDRRLNEVFDETAAALDISRDELDARVARFLNPAKMVWVAEYISGRKKGFAGNFDEAANQAQAYAKSIGHALRSLTTYMWDQTE